MDESTESNKMDATPEQIAGKAIFEASIAQAHSSQGGWKEGHEADMMMDALIAEWCMNDPCAAQKLLNKNKMNYSVEYLADNLPAVQFVSQFYLELIIHGGLVAKDTSNQAKLDAWLARKNVLGQTNGNVIREALLASIIYGYSGLRNVMGNLVFVPPTNFKIWRIPAYGTDSRGAKHPIPGIKVPCLYEIKDKSSQIEQNEQEKKTFSFDDDKSVHTLKDVIKQENLLQAVDGSFYQNDGQDGAATTNVFIPVKNFCHLRHSDEGNYGRSPLTSDRLRTTLIIDYLRNVIDEVNNDGNDYIMYLKQKGVAGSSLTNMLSNDTANKSLDGAIDPKQAKNARERQIAAARNLAKKLKRTQKTRIGIVSKDWVDTIEKMEGTVNLNEYLSVLNNAKAIIADIYGIPAMLAGTDGGGWSTGMSALIPFTLERTIKPFQQRYAHQLSAFVTELAGVKGDITFQEIDWSDERERAEIDKIKAETEKALAEANSKKISDLKTKKETKLLNSDGVNGKNLNQPNNQNTDQKDTKTTGKKS